jgi:hypothetical protein
MNCPLCEKVMTNLAIFNMDICLDCELNFCFNQVETYYQVLIDIVRLSVEKVDDMRKNGHFYWRENFYTTSEMERIVKLKAFI